jgi:hypothetical protein
MVRLWEALWSGNVGSTCRAGLRQSRPAEGTYRENSFRQELEQLEDRLMPSTSQNFFPIRARRVLGSTAAPSERETINQGGRDGINPWPGRILG